MTKRLLKKGSGIAVNKKQKPISKLFDLVAKHMSDRSGEDEVDTEVPNDNDDCIPFTIDKN